MERNRLLKTALGLLLAFAMTITPIFSSYAVIAAALDSDSTQASEIEEAVTNEEESSPPDVAETEGQDNTADKSEQNDQSVDEPVASDDQDTASDDSEQESEVVVVPDSEQQKEDAVEETEEETEEDEEEQQIKTKYVWKDSKVKVTAVLSDAEAIPDDAELVARPVVKESRDYNYDAYMEALNQDGDSRYTDKNTLLYDIAFIKDGVEIQPDAGKVSVTFEFLDSQLSESIGAKKADDVNVIHLPLKDSVRDKYDTTSDAKKIDSDDIVVETLTEKENDLSVSVSKEKVTFETDRFSVFAYTVDFEYNGYTFRLPGEGSVLLDEIFDTLKINESVKDVAEVTFSDPELLSVRKTLTGNWKITSHKSFMTEETLTVVMKNGGKYLITVTDPATSYNLADFLVSASINATQNEQGEYVVKNGTTYRISLNLEEDDNLQFPDDGSDMIYELPAGLTAAHGDSGTFFITINDGGTEYVISDNRYRVEGNKIIVDFNSNDPNYSHLTAAGNVKFNVAFDGEFSGERVEIPYKDGTKKVIIIDNANKVDASKSAEFNMEAERVDYTVSIKSTGYSTNVVVKDTITDAQGVLELIGNSITATSSTGQSVSMRGSVNGNSFEYTIPSMKDGEVITFKYSAAIDVSKIPVVDGKVVTTGQNKVEVKSDGDPTPDVVNKNTVIDYTPGIKKGNAVVGEDGKTLTWTITANEAMKVSMAGGKITDKISESSRKYMTYSGTGIKVQVYDKNGVVREENVAWGDLTAKEDYTWIYTIPTSDAGKAYMYVITYTTEVDTNDEVSQVVVNNEVTTDGDKKGSGSGTVTPAGGTLEVYKNVEKVDLENKKIDWVVNFTVPEDGLSEAVVTDTYPSIWLDDGTSHFIEKALEGTITVSGLKNNETWVPEYGDTDVKIRFYRDANHNNPGLEGGGARTEQE